ncbi:MAG: beta-lactamase family protein [Lentisphaeria bacterium]|nr:beta-lactamase family protein [Lentisphaeria bacterium]
MKQNGETLQLLKQIESLGIPSVDCVVFHKGQKVFRYCSGYSDEAKTQNIDGSERYNIYSCSKLITCTAALQLVERDILRLDDAVYEYLPEFKHMKKLADGKLEDIRNTMTCRHLFTMTAGLTYNVDSENIKRGAAETKGTMQTREAMKYLACDPLSFEPGSCWQYSLCHDVLAAVVEVVSGKKFGNYVKENIFDIVGMKRSTFMLPEEELSQIAAQYRFDAASRSYVPVGPKIRSYKLGSEYESGGAGCISTVDDYIAFIEALRSGESLLKKETIARMTVPQISHAAEKQLRSFLPDENYSYGLGVRCTKPGSEIVDYGWGGAAGAFLAIMPQHEITIFYAQHVLSSPAQAVRGLLREAVLKDLQ